MSEILGKRGWKTTECAAVTPCLTFLFSYVCIFSRWLRMSLLINNYITVRIWIQVKNDISLKNTKLLNLFCRVRYYLSLTLFCIQLYRFCLHIILQGVINDILVLYNTLDFDDLLQLISRLSKTHSTYCNCHHEALTSLWKEQLPWC